MIVMARDVVFRRRFYPTPRGLLTGFSTTAALTHKPQNLALRRREDKEIIISERRGLAELPKEFGQGYLLSKPRVFAVSESGKFNVMAGKYTNRAKGDSYTVYFMLDMSTGGILASGWHLGWVMFGDVKEEYARSRAIEEGWRFVLEQTDGIRLNNMAT
jgi:hypothetical protein